MLDRFLDKTVLGFTRMGPRMRALKAIETRLDGKRILVTGSTGGIGAEVAIQLAKLGAQVLVVGRHQARGNSVVQRIEANGGSAELYLADLSLLSEVRKLADRIVEQPLHALVNNAGVLLAERSETSEGFETSFAINALGQHLLTQLLVGHLVESCGDGDVARVINVSSGGMYTQHLRPSDLQLSKEPFRGEVFYAHTKRIQVIATEMFAARHNKQDIVFHSMHPGWVDTDGVRTSLPRFHKLLKHALRSPAEGADTIVWLCASPQATETSGEFWHDRQVRETHRSQKTKATNEARQRLWEQLEQWCQPYLDASGA